MAEHIMSFSKDTCTASHIFNLNTEISPDFAQKLQVSLRMKAEEPRTRRRQILKIQYFDNSAEDNMQYVLEIQKSPRKAEQPADIQS